MICILCYAVLCRATLYYSKLYQNTSNYIVLSFILCYSTVLYYAIFDNIILYYVVSFISYHIYSYNCEPWGARDPIACFILQISSSALLLFFFFMKSRCRCLSKMSITCFITQSTTHHTTMSLIACDPRPL